MRELMALGSSTMVPATSPQSSGNSTHSFGWCPEDSILPIDLHPMFLSFLHHLQAKILKQKEDMLVGEELVL